MSRTKKSRKPGTGSIGILKDDKKKLVEPKPRRAKKQMATKQVIVKKKPHLKLLKGQNSAKNKDPRIGNKTPIDLGKPVACADKN